MKTIFEKSQKNQRAWSLPKDDPAFQAFTPKEMRTESIDLPEISELDLMRHFSALAGRNCGIDTLFYPLGSCTMKYNPRVNEWCASLEGFSASHPLAPFDTVQGCLKVLFELTADLARISGMAGGSLLPNSGAQGEFVGVRMIADYHKKKGEGNRDEMIVPDSAHGTNPASAKLAGFKTVVVKSGADGDVDLEELAKLVGPNTAGLMLTNPNTLGLFSSKIKEMAKIVHDKGGLLYYDGANLNPMLNVCRPGAMGFDVMHINLHKTFSTPHGGGGPGSGPVVASEKLVPFLPLPRCIKKGEAYEIVWEDGCSIGEIASFYGNFAIYLRAWVYIRLHGDFGLRKIAEGSVVNANYLKAKISKVLKVPFARPCMHEFVVEADRFLSSGVRAQDLAKRMLDYGVYAPTVYFPLIVKECLLIEPTETESKATLDRFVEIVEAICREAESSPEVVKGAPHRTAVGRLDEVKAARDLKVRS